MKQTLQIPQLPKDIQDKSVEKYLLDLQKLLRDKHEDDYKSITAIGSPISSNSFVKQIIQNHITGIYSYSVPTARASAVEATCFTTQITTKVDNSQIEIDIILVGEFDNNSVFILERTVNGISTEIGSPATEGVRPYGISIMAYDNQPYSTPSIIPINFIDSPNVSAGTVATYKLKIYNAYTTCTAYINRTIEDTNDTSHERLTSNVRLTEFGGTPVDVTLYTGNNTAKMGYMHVRDEKPSGTVGGSGTAGAWNIRTLNTIMKNTIVNASLSSNIISLPSGVYRIKAKAPAYSTNMTKLRLFNVTDNIAINYGSNQYANATYSGSALAELDFYFTLINTTQVRIDQHISAAAGATQTLGIAGSTGAPEVYTEVEIWEVPEVLPLVPMASETGIATQSEAQTGLDNTKIITPLSLRQGLNANGSAPIYACRAWVNFNGTLVSGDYRRGSGNVSSITDNGIGLYTINFTTAIEDSNYSAVASMNRTYNSSAGYGMDLKIINRAVNSLQVSATFYNGTNYDQEYISIAVFR